MDVGFHLCNDPDDLIPMVPLRRQRAKQARDIAGLSCPFEEAVSISICRTIVKITLRNSDLLARVPGI